MGKKTKTKIKNRFVSAHVRNFAFNAKSLTKKRSTIHKVGEPPLLPAEPVVFYTEHAKTVIDYLVKKCTKEVGWLGLVERAQGAFIINEIYVPKQTVTSAETDIDESAMMDLFNEITADGKDPTKLIYWGHSHVHMSVSPSYQDEIQIDEYLENMPLFIRGIYNKKGESKVDVFDVEAGTVYECVDEHVLRETDPELEKSLDALIEANVQEYVYTPPARKWSQLDGKWEDEL